METTEPLTCLVLDHAVHPRGIEADVDLYIPGAGTFRINGVHVFKSPRGTWVVAAPTRRDETGAWVPTIKIPQRCQGLIARAVVVAAGFGAVEEDGTR